ncbi:MAG: MurR/RpiR family transcriptional regulator [Paracoccaceae bacterium]
MKAYFHRHGARVPNLLHRRTPTRRGLAPGELRLAEAILHFPGQIASYTATELAGMAGVSNATVTRFVRKIGYRSFEEARQAVRAEQAAGTALLRVDREGAPRDGDRPPPRPEPRQPRTQPGAPGRGRDRRARLGHDRRRPAVADRLSRRAGLCPLPRLAGDADPLQRVHPAPRR